MHEIRKNFLTKVIFKIDFEERRKIHIDYIQKVKEKINDELPKYTKGQSETIEVMMGPDEQKTIKRRSEVFDFKNEEETEWIHIAEDAVWIEVSKYVSFERFRRLIKTVVDELNLLGNSARLGLRYINQITLNDGDPFDWEKWVNSNLIKSIEFVDEKKFLARCMGIIEYNYDEVLMRFQYGMYNSEFPNPISKREFVLDYDCYTKETHDFNETFTLLNRMHDLVKEKFNYSIGSEFKKIIKEE